MYVVKALVLYFFHFWWIVPGLKGSQQAGVILQGKSTLRSSHIQNGATLTAHVRQAQLVSSALAFALLRSDGTVVTWGNAIDGGDSSAVQDELKDACRKGSREERRREKQVY